VKKHRNQNSRIIGPKNLEVERIEAEKVCWRFFLRDRVLNKHERLTAERMLSSASKISDYFIFIHLFTIGATYWFVEQKEWWLMFIKPF